MTSPTVRADFLGFELAAQQQVAAQRALQFFEGGFLDCDFLATAGLRDQARRNRGE